MPKWSPGRLRSHDTDGKGRHWPWHVLGLVLLGLAVGGPSLGTVSSMDLSWMLQRQDDESSYRPALIEPPSLWASLREPDAPVIVDVRHPALFEISHITGAINLPYSELPAHLERVPLGVKLALYCS